MTADTAAEVAAAADDVSSAGILAGPAGPPPPKEVPVAAGPDAPAARFMQRCVASGTSGRATLLLATRSGDTR